MQGMDITNQDLIHKNERKYFIVALLFSLMTYGALFLSIIGIIYVGLFIAISLFLHALMLGYIRTNGVRLDAEQFPEIYDKIRELCQKMGLSTVPDVYVIESSGALNAFATRFFGRNMVVLYSTIFELIEQEADDELAFVIAHELAHIKRRHLSKQLLILPAMWIPGITQAYSRACEYTCDRYAAYYTGNPEAAQNCLTILGIGKTLYKYVNRTQYVNQADKEKGFFIWLSEILSTHPPLPKRIKQIAIFAGQNESFIVEKSKSKKLLIWLPVSILLCAVILGGGILAIEKLEASSLVDYLLPSFEYDTPPLINAVIEGDTNHVQALLEDGADPDQQDMEEWTALHWAVKDHNQLMTRALLEAGANPNLPNYYAETPLLLAAGDGSAEMVQILLDAGANIDEQDYSGWTPLMHAVFSEDIETIQLLIEAGADTQLRDYANLTALMHAIQLGNDEIVELLRNSMNKKE